MTRRRTHKSRDQQKMEPSVALAQAKAVFPVKELSPAPVSKPKKEPVIKPDATIDQMVAVLPVRKRRLHRMLSFIQSRTYPFGHNGSDGDGMFPVWVLPTAMIAAFMLIYLILTTGVLSVFN